MAADFDRCTTVSEAVCTDGAYCGGHGQASFTPTDGSASRGTCACSCASGWYGRNCELQHGELCTINDCSHRTWGIDYHMTPWISDGNFFKGSDVSGPHPWQGVSGTRPNCRCNCGPQRQFGFGGTYDGLAKTSREHYP